MRRRRRLGCTERQIFDPTRRTMQRCDKRVCPQALAHRHLTHWNHYIPWARRKNPVHFKDYRQQPLHCTCAVPARICSLRPDRPCSVTALLINEGIFGGSAADPDPELVEKVRKQAAGAILMLRTADIDAPGAVGRRPSQLVHALVCHDVDAAFWSPPDLRNLAHGLDALCRLFRIGPPSCT